MKPFVVLILSLCSVLDLRIRAGPHAPRRPAPFVSARAGDTLLRWAGPVLCGTNYLCNMSTDKLAGNYRRRGSLLSRRGRGVTGESQQEALFYFFPHSETPNDGI